jgi:hypothetical protein
MFEAYGNMKHKFAYTEYYTATCFKVQNKDFLYINNPC